MGIDHYAVLGVTRDADADAVRKAYKRRAQRAHPDKGGDAEEFAKLGRAHEVLSDPDRRRNYDATGDDGVPKDVHAEALSVIGSMLLQIVDSIDVDNADVVEVMRSTARQTETGAKVDIARLRAKIRKLERMIRRTKGPKSGNRIAEIIASVMEKERAAIREAEKTLDQCQRVLALLAEYAYEMDAAAPKAGTSTFLNLNSVSAL